MNEPPPNGGAKGALWALLACCGVKLLIVAALLAPAGFLTRNVALGLVGLVVAGGLLWWAVRSRRRCDGSCHLPQPGTRSHSHGEKTRR